MRIGFDQRMAPVTRNLLMINLIVFLAQGILPRVGISVDRLFGMFLIGTRHFHIWQLVTYMFLHGSFWHLFSNMFALFMFGTTLERYWGSKRFLIYYMVTGVGAGIIQQLTWLLTIPAHSPIANFVVTIGASGAIFGILLAFGMSFPDARLFIIPFPFPIRAKYFVIFYGIFELYAGIQQSPGDNIAHFAHLGGMLFGYILIKYWEKKKLDGGWQDFY